MKLSIAYLGPTGTNSETAALAYADWLSSTKEQETKLKPYPSIAVAMQSAFSGDTNYAVVPIENSIEGSVTVVLDALWRSSLYIHHELTIPIAHGLLSYAASLADIKTVYSHPQGLAQCQQWLARHLPQARLAATSSTTEGIKYLQSDPTAAAVSAPRAAQLYQVPLLQSDIKDRPDNCTRFWVISSTVSDNGSHLSLAFSLPQNAPGALVKALAIFAERNINLSKIESRPSKRSLGEYIFFVDLEENSQTPIVNEALTELASCTEVLKIFGNYNLLPTTTEIKGELNSLPLTDDTL
ncbi:MAG: prephenate dehydratase [Cyanobacteria bacterium J06623_7]